MKISLNWLREFVDLNDLDYQEIGDKMTIHTAELEEIIDIKNGFNNVVVGKVINKQIHPNSDKLSIATFDCGKNIGTKQIIFGDKHHVEIGDILPIALDGAILNSGQAIKKTELRGQTSEGMIVDNSELGMKNNELLHFSNEEIGKSLPEICPEFSDILFDIDNKSLTHRPDLMGHRGFALELSAIFDRKLTLPEPILAFPNNTKNVEVDIQTKVCHRYCALEINNVDVQNSDLLTQLRLENLGIRSISNMVDITNWIILEFGQPMHVFDADKIEGKLIIRQAKKGESLVALDGETYKLDETITVIADEKKVLSIGGVMGGAASGVTKETKNIIFESAHFDPVSIRKTSQKLGLRSESSMRFEKSLDPENCRKAILTAAELTEKFCPQCVIASGLTDNYPQKFDPIIITFNPQVVRDLSGVDATDLSDEIIANKLKSLNFEITNTPNNSENWQVTVPTNRGTKDISIAEDLVEEVIRLYGFENIKGCLPELPIYPPRRNYLRELEWKIRDFLSAAKYHETYNYSFANDFDLQFDPNKKYVKVANPLSSDQKFLRTNMIANFVKNCESELRTHNELRFFEIGEVFEVQDNEVLPNEKRHLAICSAKIGQDENEYFFKIKSDLIALFSTLKLKAEFTPSQQALNYVHPSKTANIIIQNQYIGTLAVLHPQFNLTQNSYFIFAELDLNKLLEATQSTKCVYSKISTFPSVNRDLSIVVDNKILVGDIEKAISQIDKNLVEIQLFDEYIDNEKLGANIKNLTFHLKFQSMDKTLNEDEVDSSFETIVQSLNTKFQAQLRLKFDKNKNHN